MCPTTALAPVTHCLIDLQKEARLLSTLRHPHIVQFLGIVIDAGVQAIVTEFMPQVKHQYGT